jgi:hypothetical protein
MPETTTINIAPTAEDVVRFYEQNRTELNGTIAIAALAVAQGRGDVTIDRLSARLTIKPSVDELAIGE